MVEVTLNIIIFSGLFHRAIMQSGSANCFWSIRDNPKEDVLKIARHLKCPKTETSTDLVQCLQNKPLLDIVSAIQYFVVSL